MRPFSSSSTSPSSPPLPQHEPRIPPSMTQSHLMNRLRRSSPTSTSAKRVTFNPVPMDASVSISTSVSHHADPLHISRQAKQLQSDIQTYLDAQSEGLIAGLTSNTVDDAASTSSTGGSRTPTPSTTNTATSTQITMNTSSSMISTPPRTIPINQRPPKKLSLRGARKGLAHSITSFANLKSIELSLLSTQLESRTSALSTLTSFAHKRTGLTQQIEAIESEPQAQQARDLKSEADDLGKEIYELETRLLELRARHRHIVAEKEALENTTQSKLSSYQASLSLLEEQEKRFLKRPPIAAPLRETSNHDALAQSGNITREEPTTTSSFYDLRPERRTTDMAREQWEAEKSDLERRQKDVQLERDALREGSVVWTEVVGEVSGFEKMLRSEMGRMSKGVGTNGADQSAGGMSDILQKMDATTTLLQQKLSLAEDRDWKLLICAIGAELEAFREGREILLEALESSEAVGEDSHVNATLVGAREGNRIPDRAYNHRDTDHMLTDPLGAITSLKSPRADADVGQIEHHHHRQEGDSVDERASENGIDGNIDEGDDDEEEEDNDDPDPDLLISHT